MKCEICKEKVPETFLGKVVGTYVKDSDGKKHIVCSNCQKNLRSKRDVLEKL